MELSTSVTNITCQAFYPRNIGAKQSKDLGLSVTIIVCQTVCLLESGAGGSMELVSSDTSITYQAVYQSDRPVQLGSPCMISGLPSCFGSDELVDYQGCNNCYTRPYLHRLLTSMHTSSQIDCPACTISNKRSQLHGWHSSLYSSG